MVFCLVVEAVLGLFWFGSHAAYSAFNVAGVIFLNLSYVVLIAISLARGRQDLIGSPFNLGNACGIACNVISIAECQSSLPHDRSLPRLSIYSLNPPRNNLF